MAKRKIIQEESAGEEEEEEQEVITKEVVVEKELDMQEIEAIKAQTRKELEAKMKEAVTEEAMAKARKAAEADAQEQMMLLVQDAKKTEAEKELIREQMAKHEVELNTQFEQFQKEKAERKTLAKRLKAMEDKLVVGGKEVNVEQLQQQRKERQEELARQKVQLQEQRQLEDLKKKKILAIEESQMEKEEHYSSLQDEADSKTRKLNKLFAKYQGICQELKDVSEEQQREREDMLDTIRTLTRQMKLKDMIIVGFMPRDDAEKVRKQMVWDEQREQWVLQALSPSVNKVPLKRPVSASTQKRPVSDYAKIASAMGDQVGGSNPRFKSENILNLELDMPERTTYDYEGPGMNARVQAALNAAFADDSEMLYTAKDIKNVAFFGGDPGGKAGARPGSARRTSGSTSSSGSSGAAKAPRPSSALRRSKEAPQYVNGLNGMPQPRAGNASVRTARKGVP
eukprot:CAMPEP_0198199068 /NCGR_PEP_ID=MMETSP1445-20131203/2400_1 /TAXON_ID=36898 /ORGANISM="Pyramimonas sp., Strain CCMP2087" /LENGTH=454 /DNA_ID=CAMNT_0043868785 /DNA_START=137 /DNA_END=1501 /DNA_ORIENTATION=+